MENKRLKHFRSQFTEANSTRGTFEIYLKRHDFGFEYSDEKIIIFVRANNIIYARTLLLAVS